ncbi:hypothetical protein INN71_16180 [Nocardioides sp. ChNu-153]|uniref:transglutaminaseTgpA domain-containing protein n=1 Tax=unclassified Nocardioides TaxID=2615069 RepID=UPI002405C519|nr:MULTISPECIES: transglutaminaseTgpA domain-containing protein [unclassified Nocardioides]MDF9715930.1 hypothetical protein [Nocardioides sp. ChNu-99]MDN7122923.1 hypothetical protein [Nocardioides sp. ChNu-153]
MARTPGAAPAWFGPSVGLLLLLAGLALVVAGSQGPLPNDDTYFHLRFGREFLDGAWSLRSPGSVSTFATQSWVPTQWLPQVAMAWLERHGGLGAVAAASGALVVAYLGLLWALVRRHLGPVAAAALVLAVMLASAGHLTARPQVISYVLTAWFTAAWLRAVADRRAPYHLVPLTWLWVTCHGMWPVGLLVGVLACAGAWLDTRDGRTVLRLATVPLAGAVVAALTPVGPAAYGAVVAVGGRSEFFAEWGPTDFTVLSPAALALLLALLVAVLARRRRRPSWTTCLLALLALAWALYSARTVPVSAAVLAPVLAHALRRTDPHDPDDPDEPGHGAPSRLERAAGGAAVALAVVAVVVLALRTADEPDDDLAWAAPVLEALPAGTVLLDDWGSGGYLMWRHPQLDLVMHGYGDTFTVAELRRNADITDVEPRWDEMVAETGARWALLQEDSSLGYAVERDLGWERVDAGGDHVLLRHPGE